MVEHLPLMLNVLGSNLFRDRSKREAESCVIMPPPPQVRCPVWDATKPGLDGVCIVAVLHCASCDDWGSRWVYPDSCRPPNKFHTSSTEQKFPHTHTACT